MKYRIEANCWGTLGHRQAWLKENDKLFETDDLKSAEKKAEGLNKKMNEPLSPTKFRYVAREV